MYFIGFAFAGIAFLIALSIYRFGLVGTIVYLRESRVYQHWMLIILLAFIGLMVAGVARASTFEYTEIYAGLETPIIGASVQCVPGSGPDDQWTSNAGIAQHLWSPSSTVDLLAQWTHHSCALGEDRNVSDTYGLSVRWRIKW